MKICKYGKDGGPKSTVSGFWLIEIKSLFSIVLLRFDEGSREAYHSHAFNALSWFIRGNVDEHHLDGQITNWQGLCKPKYTPKNCFHKVFAKEPTWCLSIRGPWDKTWKEFLPSTKETITLTHGRKQVNSD